MTLIKAKVKIIDKGEQRIADASVHAEGRATDVLEEAAVIVGHILSKGKNPEISNKKAVEAFSIILEKVMEGEELSYV